MNIERCYSILGLPINFENGSLQRVSDEEVKRCYKQKALQFHPDKNNAPDAKENFLLVSEAFSRITNPTEFVEEDRRKNSSSSSSNGGTVSYSRGVKITQYSDGLRAETTTTKAGVENSTIYLNSTIIATAKKNKRSVTFENVKGGCYEMTKQIDILYGWSIGPRGIVLPDGRGAETKASWEARHAAAEKARAEASSLISSLSDMLGAFMAGRRGSSASGGDAAGAASASAGGSASASDASAEARQKEANNAEFLKAAYSGNVNRVESLFRSQPGIDKNGFDRRGFTALYFAASNGHLRVAKFLVEEAKVNLDLASCGGQSPLWVAAYHGRDDLALYLLEQGAKVDKVNDKNCTPLLAAADSGRDSVAKALIAKGANMNYSNKWGQTPLFTAVQKNHPRVVEVLVASGADVNKSDRQGLSPLHVAVERGFVDIAVCLMEKGNADLRQRTNELVTRVGRKIVGRKPGLIPMDYAEKCNRPDAMKQAILNEMARREGQPAEKKQRLM